MSRDARNLGELGQAELKRWASQVDITANPSVMDRAGWDYLLEFPDMPPEDYKLHSALDKLPSALQCKVQVKASDKHKGNRSISLTNWKRMIDDPLPYFILALEFEGQATCQRAYLIHVGKEYMSRVLEKQRKLSVAQKQRLHTRTMLYDYGASDALTELSGNALEEKIRAVIGETMEAYTHEKFRYRETLGYEKGKYQLSGRFSLPEGYEGIEFEKILVDLELGIIPHLELNEGQLRDIRFGIPLEIPEKEFASGQLVADKPNMLAEAEIQILTSDLKCTFSDQGRCYLATTQDGTYSKILIESNFLRVIFDDSKVGTDFKLMIPSWEKVYSLKELVEFYRLVSLFSNYRGQALNLKILVKHPVTLQKVSIGTGYLIQDGELEDWILKEVEKIKSIADIAKYFHVEDQLEFTLSQLMQVNQKWLELIDWLVIEKPLWVRYHLLMQEGLQTQNAIALFATYFDIGQFRFIFCIGHFGEMKVAGARSEMEPKPNNVEYILETNDQKIERYFYVDRGGELNFTFEEVCDSIWKDYPELDKFIVNMEKPDCFAPENS